MAGDVNAWLSAIDQLPQVVARLQRVQIMCRPALDVIPRFDDADALIYADPPYVHATRESTDAYRHEMTDADHAALAALLANCKARVIVSGYPSELYRSLYAEWRVETREIANHAAGGRGKARETECLWLNF